MSLVFSFSVIFPFTRTPKKAFFNVLTLSLDEYPISLQLQVFTAPERFGSMWFIGSTMMISSFAIIRGPKPFLDHLVAPSRLPATIVMFLS